ncbi:MAG TPA: choice-of-anchor E domain-containing protein, partial [Zoogloea sp.]|nr:choice-of-anchor E domain-containing protein [Zoogloea sp.]
MFDTNLGTLNSVTLTLTGGMTTTIDLSNSAAQSQTARGTGTVDLTFASSLAGLDLSSVLMNLTATTGLQTLAPGASASFGPLTDTDTIALTPTAAAPKPTRARRPDPSSSPDVAQVWSEFQALRVKLGLLEVGGVRRDPAAAQARELETGLKHAVGVEPLLAVMRRQAEDLRR